MAMPITQRLDEIEIGLASQRSRIETLEQVIQGLCGYIGVSPEQFLRPPPEPSYNGEMANKAAQAAQLGMARTDRF